MIISDPQRSGLPLSTSLSSPRRPQQERRATRQISNLFYGAEDNRLLRPASREPAESLPVDLERVQVRSAQVLCDGGEPFEHVYFPLSACFCYRCMLADGASLELARIGPEGFVGWPALTRGESMPFRTEGVQEGSALRCSRQALRDSLDTSPRFEQRMLLHFQTLIDEIFQTAACAQLHSIGQQTCRWLLGIADRTGQAELDVTLLAIAAALGTTSRSVSTEIHLLSAAGVLSPSRGKLTILDRTKLESHACECYRVLKRQQARHNDPPG